MALLLFRAWLAATLFTWVLQTRYLHAHFSDLRTLSSIPRRASETSKRCDKGPPTMPFFPHHNLMSTLVDFSREAAPPKKASEGCSLKSTWGGARKRQRKKTILRSDSSPALSTGLDDHTRQASSGATKNPQANVAIQPFHSGADQPSSEPCYVIQEAPSGTGELNIDHRIVSAMKSMDSSKLELLMSQKIGEPFRLFTEKMGHTLRPRAPSIVHWMFKNGVRKSEATQKKMEVQKRTKVRLEVNVAGENPLDNMWHVENLGDFDIARISASETEAYISESGIPVKDPNIASITSYLTWLAESFKPGEPSIVQTFESILDFNVPVSGGPLTTAGPSYTLYLADYPRYRRIKSLPKASKGKVESPFPKHVREIDAQSGSRRVKLLRLHDQFELLLSDITSLFAQLGTASSLNIRLQVAWSQTFARITLGVINRITLTYAVFTAFDGRVIMAMRKAVCDFLQESTSLWQAFLKVTSRQEPKPAALPGEQHLLPHDKLEALAKKIKSRSHSKFESYVSRAVWTSWFLREHPVHFEGLKQKRTLVGFWLFLSDCSFMEWLELHKVRGT